VGEARDATNLDLTGVQSELVAELAATHTPTVVVVVSGRVHTLAEVASAASALVYACPLGEEGGAALADVLFGRVDASGRLPVSFPRTVGQVPVHSGFRSGGGRSQFFRDYTDSPTTPLFPFGHGLSYASFAYGGLEVECSTTAAPVTVAVDVTNTSSREGIEVVQLYASDLVGSVARPHRQLVGFGRVPLGAGETARVTFVVDPSRLAFYDPGMRFVVEPGQFTFGLGSSWADRKAEATVELIGPVAEYRQREVVATAVSWTRTGR